MVRTICFLWLFIWKIVVKTKKTELHSQKVVEKICFYELYTVTQRHVTINLSDGISGIFQSKYSYN